MPESSQAPQPQLPARMAAAHLLAFLILLAGSVPRPAVRAGLAQQFHSVNGSLCIGSEFTETHSTGSERECAMLCSDSQRCQAFTTADGPCQLFMFDRCSKSVRDCSCSRRGRLFVKRQSGLEPGALCPPGYGDELCGVKYRAINTTASWSASRLLCESEPGLVIMADVMDSTEMEHVESLYNKTCSGGSMWLGGLQLPGSSEPAGGWVWASCGGSLSASLWASGEPSNSGGVENVTVRYQPKVGITDFPDTGVVVGALCECVSPFE